MSEFPREKTALSYAVSAKNERVFAKFPAKFYHFQPRVGIDFRYPSKNNYTKGKKSKKIRVAEFRRPGVDFLYFGSLLHDVNFMEEFGAFGGKP
jgi:hypothetical protein